MKKVLWIIPVILLITAGFAGYLSSSETAYASAGGRALASGVQPYSGGPQVYSQNEDSSYFYDRLSPYGDWTELSPYGYVWVPRHMGYRWRPYSDGHWVWTDDGWTWVANEEWGDIPFHYGRWGWDEEIGWYWVPGTLWGPAWVTWRSSDQYMGWAPLPPGFAFNVGMNFNSLSLNIAPNFWVFIQGPHFQDLNLNPYVLPFERNQTIVNFTSMHNNMYTRNNRVINEGFGIDAVRQITGRAVPTYALQNTQQPGRTRVVGQQVQVFRPTVNINNVVKPKVILNTTQARQVLAPVKVFDPRSQQTAVTEAAAVQKRQIQEKALLTTTQAQEVKNMQLQRDAEAAAAKAKVNQVYAAKITDLQKNHVVETQQITVRHQNDVAQVKRVAQAAPVKQNPPANQNQPDKKKKID